MEAGGLGPFLEGGLTSCSSPLRNVCLGIVGMGVGCLSWRDTLIQDLCWEWSLFAGTFLWIEALDSNFKNFSSVFRKALEVERR